MQHIFLAVLILFASVAAHAQLYKWTDKNGKIQYSDQPPPGDAAAEKKLTVRPAAPAQSSGSPSGATAGRTAPTLAERELQLRKRQLESEQEETKRQEETRQNKEKCAQAQARIKVFQEAPRLTVPDGAGGTMYADDAMRQKGIEEAQKEIAASCR